MTKADVSSAQEHGKEGKDGKIFIDTLKLPPCLLPSCRRKSVGQNDPDHAIMTILVTSKIR